MCVASTTYDNTDKIMFSTFPKRALMTLLHNTLPFIIQH